MAVSATGTLAGPATGLAAGGTDRGDGPLFARPPLLPHLLLLISTQPLRHHQPTPCT